MKDVAYIVRAAETPDERDAFFCLETATFTPATQVEMVASRWRRHTEAAPDYVAGQVRCAFAGTTLVGGYVLTERRLRIGSCLMPIGCLGSLVTHPHWRGQGIGAALMRDAAARAVERRLGMILLDGIAGFYHRFGYIDVLDMIRHIVSIEQILALPPSNCQTRPANLDDAPALLALYERHYARYSGSFARDLAWQRHDLIGRLTENPPLLAIDAMGQARGYLLLPWHAPRNYAVEVAADNWPATVALLKTHAAVAEASTDLDWPLPTNSPTFFALADHLDITSRSNHHRNEGWMACAGHLATLLACVKALINEQLARGATCCEPFRLSIAGSDLSLTIGAPHTDAATPDAVVTPPALLQLLFGFRPAHWLTGQPGINIPDALLPAFDNAFSAGQAWVPGSDAF